MRLTGSEEYSSSSSLASSPPNAQNGQGSTQGLDYDELEIAQVIANIAILEAKRWENTKNQLAMHTTRPTEYYSFPPNLQAPPLVTISSAVGNEKK